MGAKRPTLGVLLPRAVGKRQKAAPAGAVSRWLSSREGVITMADVKDQELGNVSGAGKLNVRYFCPTCSGELKQVDFYRGLEAYTTWECQKCGHRWNEDYAIHAVSGEF